MTIKINCSKELLCSSVSLLFIDTIEPASCHLIELLDSGCEAWLSPETTTVLFDLTKKGSLQAHFPLFDMISKDD